MSGWYIMPRGWMDEFKREPFTEREAYLWSIEQAAWEDHDQWFNGHRITVRRGEFVTSLRAMADTFAWTIKRVRGLMERLRKAGKWAQRQAYQGAQSPTVLTVINYSIFQELPRRPGTALGTVEGNRGAQQGHSEGTQQNNRKQQEPQLTGSSEAKASGGGVAAETALSPPADPAKVMFDSGIALLGDSGISERPARTMLGKWMRDHGVEAVIVALGKAQRQGAIDPKAFIEGSLRNGKRPQHHDRPSGWAPRPGTEGMEPAYLDDDYAPSRPPVEHPHSGFVRPSSIGDHP